MTDSQSDFSRHGNYYELETGFGYVTTEHNPTTRTFHIGYVFVEPDHRGNGYGRYLTEQALILARELGVESVLGTLASAEGKGMANHLFEGSALSGDSLVLAL